ncbi:MAG: rod shape-determining protein RodA [Thermodesulfobacteriota bacterium]|nr:rod shape-determining protein RodA [Thermodesulfobacteriota bacterium]
MKFDRRFILHFDWIIFSLAIIIASIGITNLYSATFNISESYRSPVYIKQLYWIIVGLFAMALSFSIDYRHIDRYAYHIFLASLILLILVIPFGKSISGAKRWIQLGIISLQPSELIKLTIILALAKYFKKYQGYNLGLLQGLIKPLIIISFPFFLIVHQPDLGTALIIILISFSILIFNGTKRTILSMIFFFFPLSLAIFYNLKDYQKLRLLTFLNPNLDPLGSGYHITQSKIAIGSGYIYGKGYLKGTQTQLNFLPEQHTDFIFSVLAEEWGFIGSLSITSLYLLLILLCIKIATNAKDDFGTLVAFGISVMIFWHVFINIGMSIGILPVVGVPLPLLSYGGSSAVTIFIAMGLLINISTRRFLF